MRRRKVGRILLPKIANSGRNFKEGGGVANRVSVCQLCHPALLYRLGVFLRKNHNPLFSMQFNGFDVYPVGAASLAVVNGVLKVTGITNSGLDGVLIKTLGTQNYTVNFAPMTGFGANNGVFKSSMLVRNNFGQVVPYFESFKWSDMPTQNVIFGYNQNLLPPSYTVFGKLNGTNVFSMSNGIINSPDSDFPPPSLAAAVWGAIVAAGALAWAIYDGLRTKTTKSVQIVKNGQGQVISTTTTITEDPVPYNVQINGTTYTVTEVGVDYTWNIPPQLIGVPSIEFAPVGEQITAANITGFDIESIT